MEENRIIQFLKMFSSNDSQLRTILIDGKWGSGKTYTINKFIEENKELNIIYLSVFGLNSVNDVLAYLSNYLDTYFINSIKGNYYLNDFVKKEEYNSVLIVFDDIERRGKSMPLKELFGIVNKLSKLGFKIICVSNLYLKDNVNEETKNIDELLEKTIDYVLKFDALIDSANNILKEIGLTINQKELDEINDNLRIVERGETIFKELNERYKDKEDFWIYFKEDKISFFKLVLKTVQLFYSEKENYESKIDKENPFYKNDIKKYGIRIADTLAKDESDNNDKNIIRGLLDIMLRKDFSSFDISIFPKNENRISSEEPFCKGVFFLSDENKEIFKNKFLKNILKFNFVEDQDEKVLYDFLNYFFNDIDADEEDKITQKIVDDYASIASNSDVESPFEVFISKTSHFTFIRSTKKKEFIEKLKGKFFEHEFKELSKEIETLSKEIEHSEKKYKELTSLLYKYDGKENEKESIISILGKQNNKFLLPNLENDITFTSWEYCSVVARYASNTKYSGDFKKYLKSLMGNSNSNSLKERCEFLINKFFPGSE